MLLPGDFLLYEELEAGNGEAKPASQHPHLLRFLFSDSTLLQKQTLINYDFLCSYTLVLWATLVLLCADVFGKNVLFARFVCRMSLIIPMELRIFVGLYAKQGVITGHVTVESITAPPLPWRHLWRGFYLPTSISLVSAALSVVSVALDGVCIARGGEEKGEHTNDGKLSLVAFFKMERWSRLGLIDLL